MSDSLLQAAAQQAKQVPLRELLLSVPADAVLRIDTPNAIGDVDTRSIPVGRFCHEAAAALASPLPAAPRQQAEGQLPVFDAAYEKRMRAFMESRGVPPQTIDKNVEIARANQPAAGEAQPGMLPTVYKADELHWDSDVCLASQVRGALEATRASAGAAAPIEGWRADKDAQGYVSLFTPEGEEIILSPLDIKGNRRLAALYRIADALAAAPGSLQSSPKETP